MKTFRILFALMVLGSFAYGIDLGLNKSFLISDGEVQGDGIATVNGNIKIGNNCRVRGTCSSVNGVIDVGVNSEVKHLQTVNGPISIDEKTHVRRDVKSVNGPVRCREGVEIKGSIKTVNGPIDLSRTHVFEDVTTYNGNLDFDHESIVEGDVVINDSHHGSHDRRRDPIIINVKGHSKIMGDLIVEDEEIQVKVYLIDGGEIMGQVYNAEVINR